MTRSDLNLDTLETGIVSDVHHKLATDHAPRIRFDTKEPFFPSVVGYTVFEHSAESPSFPREIVVDADIAYVIEYAVWWDWDIGHLYELEHIWVYVDHAGKLTRAEASWHGEQHPMVDDAGQMLVENGRLTVCSEPGKHAFAPSPRWLLDRKSHTERSCGPLAGVGGVHITPLFKGIVQDRTPLNNRLVHTYLERHAFQPSFEFNNVFDLETAILVPWENLRRWIPERMTWWTTKLADMIPPHERRWLRIAHRGASAYAQENSAESFHKAQELGADMVEIDIRATADDVPVVAHDPSLKRLYGVDALLSELTLPELRTITQSSPIMTFAETVALCRELRLGLYLDIKSLSWPAAVSVFETLEKHHFLPHAIFGSFRPDILAEIKAHRPDAVTSILFNSVHLDPVALAQSIQADYVHPCWESRSETPHKLLTEDWISRVRAARLGIVCWHEERPSEIAALKALGVDAICSDTPELLVIDGQ